MHLTMPTRLAYLNIFSTKHMPKISNVRCLLDLDREIIEKMSTLLQKNRGTPVTCKPQKSEQCEHRNSTSESNQ